MRNTIVYGPTYTVGGRELPLYNGEHSQQGFIKEILDMGLKIFSDYQIAIDKKALRTCQKSDSHHK